MINENELKSNEFDEGEDINKDPNEDLTVECIINENITSEASIAKSPCVVCK